LIDGKDLGNFNASNNEITISKKKDSALRTQDILTHELGHFATVNNIKDKYFLDHSLIEDKMLDVFKNTSLNSLSGDEKTTLFFNTITIIEEIYADLYIKKVNPYFYDDSDRRKNYFDHYKKYIEKDTKPILEKINLNSEEYIKSILRHLGKYEEFFPLYFDWGNIKLIIK
jgi:hypothetical protein